MKHSIAFFVFLLITAGLFSTTVAEAQNDAVIDSLEVALWSDYDQPAVLVIYRVQLAENSSLPAKVSLPMPLEVEEPYAAAWQGAGGQLIVAEYTSEVQGDWNIVTLDANSLVAQLEFYLDYELSGASRKAVFEWPEGFAVENLSYEVQQPVAVYDMEVIPPPDRSYTGNDGLQYYEADLGRVSEAQSIRIELSYSNPSNELTVSAFATPEPLPLSSPAAAEGGTPDISEILPWFLGILGVCLVIVSSILYAQSRRKPKRVKKKSRARTRVKASDEGHDAEVDPSTIYCHQCGTKASVSDRYCRHCGVQLRR
jgi:hypothetical protein